MNTPVIRWLRQRNLTLKILALIAFAIIFYGSSLMVSPQHLSFYFMGLALVVIVIIMGSYWIIGKRALKNILILWAIGVIIYLFFAVPRIYLGGMLSPYFTLNTLSERWFYSLLFPLLLLGSFIVGLIFIEIVSPLEFLRWGQVGFVLALLFRSFQHSIQVFQNTKTALLMRAEWPDENQGGKIRTTYLMLKASPLLIRTSLRNIILYWFPWGLLGAMQLQERQKQSVTLTKQP